MSPTLSLRRAQSGLSLIDLMVGMAIGLIGIVIITHLYLSNENYKRSTLGAGNAQVSGAIALFTLEREARMSGFAVNHSGALDCTCAGATCSNLRYYYNGVYSFPPAASATGALQPLTVAPVLITETLNQPDKITIMYGTDQVRVLPGSLTESMLNGTSDLKVDGTAGFNNGEYLLLASSGVCALMQVTSVEASSSLIKHIAGTGGSLWNSAATSGVSIPGFSTASYVFSLGSAPVWRRYSVASEKLQVEDLLAIPGSAAAAALPIVDDIVDLQAQYGKAVAVAGVVDTWDTTTPTNSTGWRQVVALRVGVLARSPNYVRPDTAGADCDATTTAPTWTGGTFTTLDFGTVTSTARCYKYRVFETIIPLRNMIWSPG